MLIYVKSGWLVNNVCLKEHVKCLKNKVVNKYTVINPTRVDNCF